MKISDVVKTFSTETFTDYHNGSNTFKGILHVQTDTTGSGPNTTRRILEVPGDAVIPSRKEVRDAYGLDLILGQELLDHHQELVRKKYPVAVSRGTATIADIGGILSSSSLLTNVLIMPQYSSTQDYEEQQSSYFLGFNLIISSVHEVFDKEIVKVGTEYYRVDAPPYVDGAGFQVLPSTLLTSPVENLPYTLKSADLANYDAETDTYTGATSIVACFIEPLVVDYTYTSPDFVKVEPGDRAISVLKTSIANPGVGDIIDNARVVAVYDRGTFNTCHCR